MKSPRKPAAPDVPAEAEASFDDDNQEGLNLRTYWLILLERKWYAAVVFLLTVMAVAVYTVMSTPIYQAVATVEILKRGAQVMRIADVVESSVTSDADFNTQIGILESRTIVENVVKQLSADELRLLTTAGKKTSQDPVGIILGGRMIAPQRTSLITSIVFRHPNPKIAARVANLIAHEYIAYNSKTRVDESLKAVDDLKDRADQQRHRVEELANDMASFRQRGNLISLVQSKDIVTEKLKALNMQATEAGSRLKTAEVRWSQVQERIKAGKDLTELPFIAAQLNVGQIVQQIANQRMALANLLPIYKAKHPRVIEAMNALAEAQRQLQVALDLAAASIQAEYETAFRNDEAARRGLAEQEAQSLDMDKQAVAYENMHREFTVNEQLLETMLTRMHETSLASSIDTQNARIIDAAGEPGSPISPNIPTNLAMGVFAGLVLAFGVAYLLATIADQVKTAFDVETVVGLPLVGVIPKTARMEQPDRAQIAANGADPMIVEAFLSLYSNLRLGPESRDARRILVTSTIPGEGKSFVGSNLALTFAAQGERTAFVDCDLRRPNVHQMFRLRSTKGVITYCTKGLAFDDVVIKNVHPNLDVITSGGRTKNPIQLFNAPEFEALVEELCRRYDRVVFDAPPIGAVGDALNLLHLMDGAIYVIRYNRVMRRTAQRCARRLASSDTPVFGAVLNDMDSNSGGEYYVEYHNKLVKEYYNPAREKAVAATPR